MVVQPEQVIVDLIPTSATTVSSHPVVRSGTSLTSRLLIRRGSDTAELMNHEQILATSESDSVIGGLTNPSSVTTTLTTVASGLSMEKLPYIDVTSSSSGDDETYN